MLNAVRDQAVTFGPRNGLVGIVTQPADYAPGDRPVFVILNTGLIHRTGHHRMFVTLSRRLAAAGHQVLRFDLSGIGDSESRGDGLSPLDGTLADIKEAVEWLSATCGARRFIVLGLCSGADHALVYGRSDPRVVGMVLLDASIPPTRQYYLRYFARHLLRPQSWLDVVTGRGRFWTTMRKWAGNDSDEVRERHRLRLGDPEVRAFLEKAYQDAMDRGIQCLTVLTSGFPHQHNYRRQILDAFPTVRFAGQLQLEYFHHTDHVFTAESDRGRLFDMVMAWTANTTFVEPALASQASQTSQANQTNQASANPQASKVNRTSKVRAKPPVRRPLLRRASQNA
jgi:pimeloyl-ACP methyl ester carboxylesterase